ncbi:MAG: FAD-binding oxidoreductase [Verrucomicrobia bacterium]|nr:FAD-binding oxidoreductase [Verrucomicrobiota bacterium]
MFRSAYETKLAQPTAAKCHPAGVCQENPMPLLNDVHSALNPTEVLRVERPSTIDELQAGVRAAAREGRALSCAGGRHAMGGQQFARNKVHLDTTALKSVLSTDCERGLLRIEAGATWPDVIAATHSMATPRGGCWAIRQKQTGVDNVTLGGSISANAHGRGLAMQPLVEDIEDLTLVDAHGEQVLCSRTENPELFSLAIGGYGLFGIIYAATLRLTPRRRVVRLVDVLDLSDGMNAVWRRFGQGCLYGDFQFVIDPRDPAFLQRGVFACYRPVDDAEPLVVDDASADLQPDAWLRLLGLAHNDKAAAFRLYAQHYVGTHGNGYWSDTMQLSTYLPGYAEFLASHRPPETSVASAVPETLVIGEHYVPRQRLAQFMEAAGTVLRAQNVEVIYGTIRSILRDTTSFLPWAKDDFACIVFNLRTRHDDAGRRCTADAFRGLIDAALDLDGSFFLTYHRHATREQLLRAYPRLPDFLAAKRRYDPEERFVSDWYEHVSAVLR